MIYILIPSTKERRDRLAKCIEAIKQDQKYPTAIVTYENEDGCTDVGWVKALHKLLDGIKDDQLVFVLGDDALVSPGCIQRLYEGYTALPQDEEWLLQPYEQFHKGELATFPFCKAGLLKKYVHRGYKHLYSDTELTLIMKAKNRYGIVKEAKVDHQHFLNDARLLDDTYRATQKFHDEDAKLFHERAKHQFYFYDNPPSIN